MPLRTLLQHRLSHGFEPRRDSRPISAPRSTSGAEVADLLEGEGADPAGPSGPDAVLCLLWTGGSTRAKLVAVTHRMALAEHDGYRRLLGAQCARGAYLRENVFVHHLEQV